MQLLPVELHTKATSCVWAQSSTPIVLAGQLMSLLSVPKQRISSSHVGESDRSSLKLHVHGIMYNHYSDSCLFKMGVSVMASKLINMSLYTHPSVPTVPY